MNEVLLDLSEDDLRALASALRSARLSAPLTPMSVQRFIQGREGEAVARALEALSKDGFTLGALAMMLELLADDRRCRVRPDDVIDLVTTGPEVLGVTNRDTAVVVRELFAGAEQSVLVAGYAVYQGQRVFAALAERMEALPRLKVRMLLDIQRKYGDTTAPRDLVHRFVQRFRTTDWPAGKPLPEVYYYPPSLELDATRRSSLHAKCVVADRRIAFVSSANFTAAAQHKNIEVGVLIKSRILSERLARHFDALVEAREVEELVF